MERGIALRLDDQAEAALSALRCALALGGGAQAQAQVGLTEKSLGRWLEAEADLQAALRAGSFNPEERAAIERNLKEVQQNLGDLVVLGGPAGAQVLINGQIRSHLPMARPLHLVIGTVTLEVRAAGHYPILRQIALRPAGLVRETIILPEGRKSRSPIGSRKLLGWLAVAGAGLTLSAGIAAQGAREGLVAGYNDNARCLDNDGNTRDYSCGHLLRAAGVAQNLAIAGFTAGAALSAVALGLLIPAYRPNRKEKVRLAVDLRAPGLLLEGAF